MDSDATLEERYERSGDPDILDEAISTWQQRTQDASSENLPPCMNNLATWQGRRFLVTGEESDLEEAIWLSRTAVDAALPDYPRTHHLLSTLGTQLGQRFLAFGDTEALDEAITITRDAIAKAPKDGEIYLDLLHNLSMWLREKYDATGEAEHLEKALEAAQEAVDKSPPESPDHIQFISSLGTCLSERYLRHGMSMEADLEKAISMARETVDATPKHHPSRPSYLSSLGIRLGYKFARSTDIKVLNEAIDVGRESTELCASDSIHKGSYLSNLAGQLWGRYTRKRSPADLEEAIKIGRQAVELTLDNDVVLAERLQNLGVSLSDRFEKFKKIEDLDEAIDLCKRAVSILPRDHQNRANCLMSLGEIMATKAANDPTKTGNAEAIQYLWSVVIQMNAPALSRIRAGAAMVEACILDFQWPRAYQAAIVALELISDLPLRNLETTDKQHILGQISGLASDAAAVALQGEKAEINLKWSLDGAAGLWEALRFLEQGRGVISTSTEDMRTDIQDLRELQPVLADQLSSIRNEMASLGPIESQRRYELDKQLEKLISTIRRDPDFMDFLHPPRDDQIQEAAQKGPIIVVNVSKCRCDAIIVDRERIVSVPLPKVSVVKLKSFVIRGLGTAEVLEWLWDAIASPVFNALGFTSEATDLPHVWWIPTGPLTKFPLHAAGYHRGNSSKTVMDRAVSSYSTSIKALMNARRRSTTQSTSNQALLVAMENTPGAARLGFVKKETAILRDLCPSLSLTPIEPGRSQEAVVSNIRDCKIFHFAGHGSTDNLDPSRSHLILSKDGKKDPLTVAQLLELNLHERAPFVAYLSACGTGRVKAEKFLDESIHLISAFHLAGFRHVIGTLWEVDDQLCVDMARITYGGLIDEGFTDESIARAIHKAGKDLRDKWIKASEIRGDEPVAAKEEQEILEEMENTRLRDVDGDSDEEEENLLWVPYVHFGA